MSHCVHMYTGGNIFGLGDLRSHSARRRPTEDDESAQTSMGRAHVAACVGCHYLYKKNDEEIEVCYPSELLE